MLKVPDVSHAGRDVHAYLCGVQEGAEGAHEQLSAYSWLPGTGDQPACMSVVLLDTVYAVLARHAQVDDFYGVDVQRLEDHLWLHKDAA